MGAAAATKALEAAGLKAEDVELIICATLSPDRDGTRVSYHAVVVPDFPGGVEFGASMMEDQVREQIRAYIGEMTRRASLAQAGKSRPRKGA